MKDRITKILREEGMTAAKFAEEIGVQASGISHILSGRNKPSTDFLIKILERFRGINAEWLILGKGNMYKSAVVESPNVVEKPVITSQTDLFSSSNKVKADDNQSVQNGSETEKSFENTNRTESTQPQQSDNRNINSFTEKTAYERPINTKKTERIVIFFDDNTFESYNPNK